jgi:hypothetical protein
MPTSSRALPHLWVVVTQPEPGTSLAVCVSITSRRLHSETTVILYPRDHPFIKHESVMHYRSAKILDFALVQKALDGQISENVCRQHQCCEDNLLRRIQEGMLISAFVKNDVKAECRRMFGV